MLSIIVPTLNEGRNIDYFSSKIKNLKFRYELIYVDDNSTDNSQAILKKNKKKNIKFIIRKNKERDLSKSVILGLTKAKYDHVMVMDCDNQHNISDANKMYKIFLKKKLDLIIGSRFKYKKFSGNLGIKRSLSSYLFLIIINLILPKITTDPLSGFFICKKKILLSNKKRYFLKGYKILFDIIYNSKTRLKTFDFQINFGKRRSGQSKMNKKIVLIFIRQFIFTLLKKF